MYNPLLFDLNTFLGFIVIISSLVIYYSKNSL